MEGLEISIKLFSELSNDDDDTLRYDSEHYQRKYIKINETLKKLQHSKLLKLIKTPVITGHTPSMKVDRFYGGKIKFIKTDNLRENKIVEFFTDYLTEEGNQELKKSELRVDDVLVTIIGATFDVVGRCAIIRAEHLPANINQNIAIIRVDKNKIDPNYLNIYLNTRYGKASLYYHSRQTEQVNLNCREVERVLVPIFEKLEKKVADLSKKADSTLVEAKRLYVQAQTLLLDSLGLADFSPSKEKVNIKSFKESFGTSGRLDAEYYQRKYEQVLAHIVAQPHAQLATVVNIQKSIEPGSDAYVEENEEGLPFLRVADYSKFGITKPQQKLKDSFVADNSTKLDELKPKKDTILFSKDGSVGEAYCLRENANFITSGAILHLTVHEPKKLLPDYLTLVLNSKLVQMQAERDAGGSILLHWRVGEIKEVVVPLIDIDTQTQIASLIQQSFSLKTESERLLEAAKRAVEIAIEEDEKKAIEFLNDETERKIP